jgi:hypothetical protein
MDESSKGMINDEIKKKEINYLINMKKIISIIIEIFL